MTHGIYSRVADLPCADLCIGHVVIFFITERVRLRLEGGYYFLITESHLHLHQISRGRKISNAPIKTWGCTKH